MASALPDAARDSTFVFAVGECARGR